MDERIIAMQLGMLKSPQQVLIIQTDTTLPYSSIGIELDYAGSSAAPQKKTQQTTPYRHADLKP